MKKMIALITGLILLGTSSVFAEVASPTQPAAGQAPSNLVEVGNKFCPVSGRAVGQMGPVIKHEYNGKIYNLCCPACPAVFDKDPAKYAKIAEDQLAAKK